MSASCHKWSRLDRLAAVCLSCETREQAFAKVTELEDAGYNVSVGYCPRCIVRFAMDSIRGTHWAIPECGS